MDGDTTPQSRLHDWNSVSEAEIKTFCGLVLWMGLVKLPSIRDYWSRQSIYDVRFGKSSRNRFKLILRMIHFSYNQECPKRDRLYKIQFLVDMLVHNFQTLYTPYELICVDETMVPFRGRLVMSTINKNKKKTELSCSKYVLPWAIPTT